MHIVDPKPRTSPPTYIRYVPHGDVAKFEAAGWAKRRGLAGTHHGIFAVLMEWTGDGEPPK